MRKNVCRDLQVKYKHKDNFYCVLHYPSESKRTDFEAIFFDKIKKSDYQFNGTWFPIEIDFSDYTFARIVNFGNVTFNHNVSFERAKFLDYQYFVGTNFKSRVSFSKTLFSEATDYPLGTNFFSVVFENVVDFSSAKFMNKVDFGNSKFLVGYSTDKNNTLPLVTQTSFAYAEFNDAANFGNSDFGLIKQDASFESILFIHSLFNGSVNFKNVNFLIPTNFNNAVFKQIADFRNTNVKNTLHFDEVSFESSAKFSGKDRSHTSWSKNGLKFSFVNIEKAEKISFHTLRLNPESFLNTDTRKFEFTDIQWTVKNFAFDWSRFKDIFFWTENAKSRKSGYEILSIAYRRLATNAEENNRYSEASKFRFTANEIQRIGNHWFGRLPSLSWLYKWSSRYGENWLWALFVLLCIMILFTFYYHFAYFVICPQNNSDLTKCLVGNMSYGEALHQSLMSAALQNIEYRKSITYGEDIMILLEKILIPIQAALLALAIRRKFMR